jgi:hypothetical protein
VIAGGTYTKLSRQQILECTWDYGNFGCDGGTYDNVFYYAQIYGLMTDAAYPLNSTVGSCTYPDKIQLSEPTFAPDVVKPAPYYEEFQDVLST